jgi:hypothetical protein
VAVTLVTLVVLGTTLTMADVWMPTRTNRALLRMKASGQERPSACPTPATAAAVASTRPVASSTIPRRFVRISRSEVVSDSQ